MCTGQRHRDKASAGWKSAALIFLALGVPVIECAPGSAPSWRSLTVSALGWGGADVDMSGKEPKQVRDYLVGTSRIWLSPGPDEESLFVACHPTPPVPEEREAAALRVARVVWRPSPTAVDALVSESDLGGDAVEHPLWWEAGGFAPPPATPAVWYMDVGRGQLYKHDLSSGKQTSFEVPAELLEGVCLQLAVGPHGRRVHVALTRPHRSSLYGVFDVARKEWSLTQFRLATQFLVAARGDTVYLLHMGDLMRLYVQTAAAEPVASSHSDGAPGLSSWEEEVIGPRLMGDFLLTATASGPHVFCLPVDLTRGLDLVHWQRGQGGWERELVWAFDHPPAGSQRHAFLGISATEVPGTGLHIACYDPAGAQVVHLFRAQGAWRREEVASGDLIGGTAIAAVSGRLVIAYASVDELQFRVAFRPLQASPPEKGASTE